jgi:hypothetical protein
MQVAHVLLALALVRALTSAHTHDSVPSTHDADQRTPVLFGRSAFVAQDLPINTLILQFHSLPHWLCSSCWCLVLAASNPRPGRMSIRISTSRSVLYPQSKQQSLWKSTKRTLPNNKSLPDWVSSPNRYWGSGLLVIFVMVSALLQDLYIPPSDIEKKEEIAEGQFGTIFRAILRPSCMLPQQYSL